MMRKRRSGLLYLLILWFLISALAWPAFVISATALSYFAAEAWQLDAWTQIPKREILKHFLEGYKMSAIISIPIGVVAIIDYLLLSRYRITWIAGGVLLPAAGALIALSLYRQPMTAMPTLILTGFILAIVHRLIDLLAGNAGRGGIR
ncbi:MAG: hypothetical protein AB8B79_00580 [Granulosicoccus sp.]